MANRLMPMCAEHGRALLALGGAVLSLVALTGCSAVLTADGTPYTFRKFGPGLGERLRLKLDPHKRERNSSGIRTIRAK